MIVLPPVSSVARARPGPRGRARRIPTAEGRARKPARAVMAAAAFLTAAVGIAWMVDAHGPLMLAAGTAAAAAVALLTLRPASGVLLAVFLLFTNLPVVAAQDGLLPRAAAALVGLLFVPALAHHLVVRRRRLRLDRTFGLLAAFLAALLLSAFVAVDPDRALERIGVFVMEGLVVYVLVVNTVRDLPTLRRVLAVVVGAAALLAVLAGLQAGSGSWDRDFGGLAQLHPEVEEGAVQPVRDEPRAEGRVRGPVDDPNRFAQILLLAAPFAFLGWMRGRKAGARVPAVGAGLVILGGILLTYSRGAFLTLLVLVVVAGILGYVRPSRIVAAALVAAFLIPPLVPGYVERVKTIAGTVGLFSDDAPVEPDAVTRGRTTEMLAALLAFREHPVLGVGPGQYMPHYSVQYQLRPEIRFRDLPVPRRAHDLYAEVAAETGAVGLVAFLAIPGFLLLDLLRLRRGLRRRRPELDPIAGAFILSILGYLGTGVFLHLAYERYYWLFLALAAAAVSVLRSELESGGAKDAPAPDRRIRPVPRPVPRRRTLP